MKAVALVELPILKPVRTFGIFEQSCPTECIAWDVCGGAETAPCGCVWTEPERRHQCRACHLVCRERNVDPRPGELPDSFRSQISAGRSLDDLTVSQPSDLSHFPIFIPTRTNALPRGTRLPLKWAAVSARTLFTKHTSGPVEAKTYFTSPERARAYTRVDADTQLLAVLNAQDFTLEGFWGTRRSVFYKTLQHCGFAAATGPTFSIITDPNEAPAAHNVCMLLRHHQVVHELEATNLIAIPNLYWRDYRDRWQWGAWLAEQENVHFISRDFSRTRDRSTFLHELAGLIEIIKLSGKTFHVFLVGVGSQKAGMTLLHLDSVGCTASVVTGSPIIKAMFGGCELKPRGAMPPDVVKNKTLPRKEIALRNLEIMEQFVLEVVSPLASYQDYRPLNNGLVGELNRRGGKTSRRKANGGNLGG